MYYRLAARNDKTAEKATDTGPLKIKRSGWTTAGSKVVSNPENMFTDNEIPPVLSLHRNLGCCVRSPSTWVLRPVLRNEHGADNHGHLGVPIWPCHPNFKLASERRSTLATKYLQSPRRERVLWRLGRLCLDSGRGDDADQAFAKELQEYPQGAYAGDAMVRSSMCRWKIGLTWQQPRNFRVRGACCVPEC